MIKTLCFALLVVLAAPTTYKLTTCALQAQSWTAFKGCAARGFQCNTRPSRLQTAQKKLTPRTELP